MEQWSSVWVLIPNQGVLCSKPLDGFRVNSAFHAYEVDQMSTHNP